MANDKPVKNIVFDLGNVLIRWDPRNLYRKIFADPNEMEFFLTQVCSLSWNERTDGTLSFADAMSELILQHPKYELQIRDYHGRWEEMLGGVISETEDILRTLKQKNEQRLFALSNWSKETFPIAQKNYSFLAEFEGLVVSGYVGLIKPDPRIYQHLCKTHDLIPEESLFIDDVKKNIEAAQSLGFQTHHFSNAKQLHADLTARGIL